MGTNPLEYCTQLHHVTFLTHTHLAGHPARSAQMLSKLFYLNVLSHTQGQWLPAPQSARSSKPGAPETTGED